MKEGDCIINTSSVTAYNGSPGLIDYSATKGAITSFTRSLALNLAKKGIRVNAVAPGPIWTPLIPATFDAQKVEQHGSDTPVKRRGQPAENAPAFVFLASNDSSYMTGQTIHVDGGGYVGLLRISFPHRRGSLADHFGRGADVLLWTRHAPIKSDLQNSQIAQAIIVSR